MTTINQKTASLLDKVYNLCGNDSVIFAALNDEQAEAEQVRNETSILKMELDSKLEELKNTEKSLIEDGNRFSGILSEFTMTDFSKLIEVLELKFDPVDLSDKLNTRLPDVLNDLSKDKTKTKEELEKTIQEMNESIAKLGEINVRRQEAAANQELLRRYFDLAVSANINITRDDITSLLARCGFDDNDQRAAAKLLMFPEDGLFDYMYLRAENPDAESVVDILKSSKNKPEKEEVVEEIEEVEEPQELVEEASAEEVVIDEDLDIEDKSLDVPEEVAVLEEEVEPALPEIPAIEDTPVEDIKVETVEEEPKEETAEPTKEDLINLLNSLGLDYLDFKEKEFDKLLANYDEELYKKNIELVNALGMKLDLFTDNYELLFDKDLTNKVTKLTEVGKLPEDIYLNPSVLIKYDYKELESAINVLVESGLEPKRVPLMAY